VTPHAPWANGPTDFRIGLTPVDVADWFEGGEVAAAIVARKTALRARAPELVWAETPGSEAGQAEALALVQAWARRPAAGGEALWAAGLLVSDDLCLMERSEGEWRLSALSLCAGSLFNAGEVIGRPLSALHAPVPGFAERLLARVGRIFDRLTPDTVLVRRNWTVLASDALHLPHAPPVRGRAAEVTAETAGEALHIRVERQSLRRLPATGGLLFSIRVWLRPLGALDEMERGRFAEAWRGASPELRAYKSWPALDVPVEGWLARQEGRRA
jgi:hypothetical protein